MLCIKLLQFGSACPVLFITLRRHVVRIFFHLRFLSLVITLRALNWLPPYLRLWDILRKFQSLFSHRLLLWFLLPFLNWLDIACSCHSHYFSVLCGCLFLPLSSLPRITADVGAQATHLLVRGLLLHIFEVSQLVCFILARLRLGHVALPSAVSCRLCRTSLSSRALSDLT